MNYLDMIDSQTFISEADVYISQLEMFQKQILMEQTAPDPDPGNTANIGAVPDPVSKWQQFVNWITRLIMKLRTFFMSKKVEKRIGKLEAACKNLSDNQKDTYSVPSYVAIFIHTDPENYNIGDISDMEYHFSPEEGREYQRNAEYFEEQTKKLKDLSDAIVDHDKKIDKKININKRQFVIAIKNIAHIVNCTKKVIEGVDNAIKSLKKKLSNDDRKSQAFQQYVIYLTKGVQMLFYYMKYINNLLLWTMENENIFTAEKP